MIKVLVADDHAVVCKGLQQIFETAQDIQVEGEAKSGSETILKVREGKFDVVILDLSFPDMSGLDVLKQIKLEKPELPVLIYTMQPKEQFAVRLLKAGAAGYLNKEDGVEDILEAVRHTVKFGRYITPDLANELLLGLNRDTESLPHVKLSDREFQIMLMIAEGKMPKEIATTLCISVKTVATYRARILEKMEMQSSAQITHYVISNGLLHQTK